MPKNTGVGVYIGALSFVLGFAAVWHMFWLFGLCSIGIIVVMIFRLADKHTDYHVTVEEIKKIVREQNVDAVLTARMIEKKTVETEVGGSTYIEPIDSYNSVDKYFERSFNYTHTPGYVIEDQIAVLETNIYTLSDGKLIYNAKSETFIANQKRDNIKSYIKAIIKSFK